MYRQRRRQLLRGGLTLAGLGLLAGCGVPLPWAQQPPRVPRIGVVSNGTASGFAPNLEAFRQGMRELGYVEGQTIAIEERNAAGGDAELDALMADLIDLKVDVLVATGTPTAQAAKRATESTPIVTVSGDPVEAGLVASLARPGGNVTGLTVTIAGRAGKRLELLKEAVPAVSRVASLGNAVNSAHVTGIVELQDAAPRLAMEFHPLEVRPGDDLAGVLESGLTWRPDALLVQDDPLIFARRADVLSCAARNRIAAIYQRREWADSGGLMSYGANFLDVHRRAATYVDKILKGARPADLPVEQPTTFDFVVNVKTAQALGMTIPPSVMQQATEVIQ
jgi:putative ABC transport system substrate-binding protein